MVWISNLVFRREVFPSPKDAIKSIVAQALEWAEKNDIKAEFIPKGFKSGRKLVDNVLVVICDGKKYTYKVHTHSEGTLAVYYGTCRDLSISSGVSVDIPDYKFKHCWLGQLTKI